MNQNYCCSTNNNSMILAKNSNNIQFKETNNIHSRALIKTDSKLKTLVNNNKTQFKGSFEGDDEFEVGSTITPIFSKNSNSYKLIKKLGSGSYAVVYLSIKNNNMDEKVALKCVNIKYKEKELVEMQLKEVEYLKKLKDCSSIAKFNSCFESKEYKNHLFIEMEFVEGQDLYEYLVEDENMVRNNNDNECFIPEKNRFFEIKPIFTQILKCVESCHNKNIFHRDLKPENFMINKDTKQIKLIDFGLATAQKKSKEFKFGSKAYMSPECRSEDYNKKGYYIPRLSDIWSLGIIFLNLLCFRSPWNDPTSTCSEFSDFKIEGTYYLVRELDCSYTVADYLTSHIFCNEKSRDSIDDFQNWIDNLYKTKTKSILIENSKDNSFTINANQVPKTVAAYEDPTKMFITPDSSPNTNFNHFNKFIDMNNIDKFDWADDDFIDTIDNVKTNTESSFLSSNSEEYYHHNKSKKQALHITKNYSKNVVNSKVDIENCDPDDDDEEFTIHGLLEKMDLNE